MIARLVLIVAMALAIAAPAFANPGVEPWVKDSQSAATTETTFVSAGGAVYLSLNSGSGNSKVLRVSAAQADLCFDPDVGGTGGSARVNVYRALDYNDTTNAAILVGAPPFDGSDCIEITIGRYWIEVTTAATGGEVARVLVQGR